MIKILLIVIPLGMGLAQAHENEVVLGSARVSLEFGDAVPSIDELKRHADANAVELCSQRSRVQRISDYDVRRKLIPYFGSSLSVSAFYLCEKSFR